MVDYKCPKCGYIMSDIERVNLVVDIGCPRCSNPLNLFEMFY